MLNTLLFRELQNRKLFLLSFKFPSVRVTYYICDELALSQDDIQRYLLFRSSTHAWVFILYSIQERFCIPYDLKRALVCTLFPSEMFL